MLEIIKSVISGLEVDHYKIIEDTIESKELFFIKKDLDMNRGKAVVNYAVTIYRVFEEDDQKYMGSSTVSISPTMEKSDVEKILEKAAYAATFVKNPYYPMAKPSEKEAMAIESQFSKEDIMQLMMGFKDSIYKNDMEELGGVNSAEIFLNRGKRRIVTSEGIDVEFNHYDGEIELITDWEENGESVELYNMMYFSDYCPELIEAEAKSQIKQSKERALAVKSPDLKNINVILKDEAVKEVMEFYYNHANARAVYEKVSTAELDKVFQGEDVKGDLINITLDPFMKNSPASAPYDGDGVYLEPVNLFEEGVLKRYHGSMQHSSYLNIEPTGKISNMRVEGGTKNYQSFKEEPYVEVLTFSDFQMDTMTGDLGGEIRLAMYFDGEKTTPITGASLSANLFKIQKEMYLSKETTQKGNYMGPKALMFPNLHIAGE
jgi:PmbA protein